MTNYTTILTSVKDALNTAVDTIKSAQKALFAQANTEKANLIALLNEMAETKSAIGTLGNNSGEAGNALLTSSDGQLGVAEKISDVIDYTDIPVASYENFVAFCDDCGKEILVDEEYSRDSSVTLCNECFVKNIAKEEEEAEQLEIELDMEEVAVEA